MKWIQIYLYVYRYSGIKASDLGFLSTTSLGKACGARACDSNHTVGEKTPCISYESGATGPEVWALKGEIELRGDFQNIPDIEFCSKRLAQIFVKGTDYMGEGVVINQKEVLMKIEKVLEEYTNQGILWDLVFWAKFSGQGKCSCDENKFLWKHKNVWKHK